MPDYLFGQASTKQHPVDSGIQNAKEKIDEATFGGFSVSDDDVAKLSTLLREIWDDNQQSEKIPEEFMPAIFEIIAHTQFKRMYENDEELWDKAELERAINTIWEIIERWLKPSKPR